MTYKGVLFDFNGTLFWDTKLHNEAWDVFLEKHNIHISDNDKFRTLHGKNNKEIFRKLFGEDISDAQVEKHTLEKEGYYMTRCHETKTYSLAPGAGEFFDFLKAKDVPFTIATASGKENVEFYFEYLGIANWFEFDKISYNDGTMRGKPNPDIYLKGMDIIDCKAPDVLVFEDAVAGLQAAKNAEAGGIIVVNSNDDNYAGWENYQIIKSFNEVNRSQF